MREGLYVFETTAWLRWIDPASGAVLASAEESSAHADLAMRTAFAERDRVIDDLNAATQRRTRRRNVRTPRPSARRRDRACERGGCSRGRARESPTPLPITGTPLIIPGRDEIWIGLFGGIQVYRASTAVPLGEPFAIGCSLRARWSKSRDVCETSLVTSAM